MQDFLRRFRRLHDRLQLPSVADRVLDDLAARHQHVLVLGLAALQGKVYPAVLDDPATLPREADDGALALQEQ
jgi:hypothetical protein